MRLPIVQQDNLSEAKSCPFYCLGSDNRLGCVVKSITTEKMWNLVKSTNELFSEEYKKDCNGEFENCCFSNLIWREALLAEEESKNFTEALAEEPEEPEEMRSINVEVHKVENIYLVKSDALIYPTNNLLQIDDILLNKMSKNRVQFECDQLHKNPKMGGVYATSNGGDHSGGIKAKKIYHAVVAGESRLINEQDIINSITKALMMADSDGARIVTMIPADCGNGLDLAAFPQLSAVKTFLSTTSVNNIEFIFIIMDDQESYEIYVDEFSKIFNDD